MSRVDRASLFVAAQPAAVYAALTTPSSLETWLPPTGMSGRIEEWDQGSGYRMVLAYDDPAEPGKTGDGTDVVTVRFVVQEPPTRLVVAASFDDDDPGFAGAMRMTWTLTGEQGGTVVSLVAEDVPDSISEADHQTGMNSSLAQLAEFLGGPIASTPVPPYTAVIFTSVLRTDRGYGPMAARMEELAAQQPGFLGVESARDGLGITVSYWVSETAAAAWKNVAEHLIAQDRGRSAWYAAYRVRIATVEREYGQPD